MIELNTPEPMSMRTAIECMKILKHYAPDIRHEKDPMTLVKVLINAIRDRQPADVVRLVSLMYGISPEEVVEKVNAAEDRGSMFYRILVEGFIANPLPDLVNAGYMIGLMEEGWTD